MENRKLHPAASDGSKTRAGDLIILRFSHSRLFKRVRDHAFEMVHMSVQQIISFRAAMFRVIIALKRGSWRSSTTCCRLFNHAIGQIPGTECQLSVPPIGDELQTLDYAQTFTGEVCSQVSTSRGTYYPSVWWHLC